MLSTTDWQSPDLKFHSHLKESWGADSRVSGLKEDAYVVLKAGSSPHEIMQLTSHRCLSSNIE